MSGSLVGSWIVVVWFPYRKRSSAAAGIAVAIIATAAAAVVVAAAAAAAAAVGDFDEVDRGGVIGRDRCGKGRVG